ncbi:hypothetical protein [Alloactinosynnema sp. L-07]|uniref:hypothetical protein n=1 Tax=Alloactinosynnema sp. L-07 TaxID=1653480 RepID=UPI0012FCB591|nr:hypothetical protein [Alloactinosynnema sp. L-07]
MAALEAVTFAHTFGITHGPCVRTEVNGQIVEENVGTQLTDRKHFMPYSIPAYLSQIYGTAPATQARRCAQVCAGWT